MRKVNVLTMRACQCDVFRIMTLVRVSCGMAIGIVGTVLWQYTGVATLFADFLDQMLEHDENCLVAKTLFILNTKERTRRTSARCIQAGFKTNTNWNTSRFHG